MTGWVSMTCPVNRTASGGLEVTQRVQMHCEVCGGVTSGDIDSREGQMEVQISWGPNTFKGVIDELSIGILGYAVFAVNECGQQQGNALATIAALGIQRGIQQCCETSVYGVSVSSQLPDGVTSQAFMVVPLTSIGALHAGWITAAVVDVAEEVTPTQAPAQVVAETPAPAQAAPPEPDELLLATTTQAADLAPRQKAVTNAGKTQACIGLAVACVLMMAGAGV